MVSREDPFWRNAVINTNQEMKAREISWMRLIAYGSGGIIPIALFNIAGQLIGLIGNIGLGLSAFWLGVIMIIPRIWDAMSDPIMGHITDQTRSRFGRRRPYILIGGILVAISFVCMWWIPSADILPSFLHSEKSYNIFTLGYILFQLLIFYTACTIFEIPHGALGMEMTSDPHMRTCLFSAKSFLGNLFAMGTPWLFFLANLEFFRGQEGNEASGMRWVSVMLAIVLIPLSFWWFFACKEKVNIRNSSQIGKKRKGLIQDIRSTFHNQSFLMLIGIFFILSMGFNCVSLLSYYISIFYLFDGDKQAASFLLGVSGTIWAVTGLLAVFPLNWLSRKIGKKMALLISIFLMLLAQLLKIVCYSPEYPYLILIPTVLLSAGMLMFFTLGPSMLGDLCDEEATRTGNHAQGSYYAVFWWFLKMGSAFAGLLTGILITLVGFDEERVIQNDKVGNEIMAIESAIQEGTITSEIFKTRIRSARQIFESSFTGEGEHAQRHCAYQEDALNILKKLELEPANTISESEAHIEALKNLRRHISIFSRQTDTTIFRLRLVEISLPFLLSLVSLWLAFRYPYEETPEKVPYKAE